MKIAAVGSRNLFPDKKILSENVSDADEIVSGGASGVDKCAADHASRHGIRLTVFLPN